MGAIRFGPARWPSRESPEEALRILRERGYSACELDFESGFWLDYPAAERLGELARESDIALSVHAPLFAFPGHPDPKKAKMALGALDRLDEAIATSAAEGGTPLDVAERQALDRVDAARRSPAMR